MTKWVLALAAGLALLAAACGGSDHSSSADEVEVPASADYNAADVMFAQGMIPHHEQAVEMADLALANTTTPAVVDLANRINELARREGYPYSTTAEDVGAWHKKRDERPQAQAEASAPTRSKVPQAVAAAEEGEAIRTLRELVRPIGKEGTKRLVDGL